MESIYEIIYQAMELAFPLFILEHSLYGFIIESIVFLLALGIVIITAYIPFIIAYRLALRGVKKWF